MKTEEMNYFTKHITDQLNKAPTELVLHVASVLLQGAFLRAPEKTLVSEYKNFQGQLALMALIAEEAGEDRHILAMEMADDFTCEFRKDLINAVDSVKAFPQVDQLLTMLKMGLSGQAARQRLMELINERMPQEIKL